VIGLALIQFAEVPEPCQKGGKVGRVKQRLLAELDAFEVTSFDRCVQRSAADTEQLKCLVDGVRYFRKAEAEGSIGSTPVLLSLSTLDTALFVETWSWDLRG
jgi:hypothetical protein